MSTLLNRNQVSNALAIDKLIMEPMILASDDAPDSLIEARDVFVTRANRFLKGTNEVIDACDHEEYLGFMGFVVKKLGLGK